MKTPHGVTLLVSLLGTSLPLAGSAENCDKGVYRGESAIVAHARYLVRVPNRQTGVYAVQPQHAVYRYSGSANYSDGHASDTGRPGIAGTAGQAGAFNNPGLRTGVTHINGSDALTQVFAF